jgi:8-oxo-dGTP pyrophosphatase MutT (NUDIX family)
VTGPTRILKVAELDFVLEPSRWPFAETRRAEIASHWAELRRTKPALYNGRILLLGRREFSAREDGQMKLTGAYFEADYADFVAWRSFRDPGDRVENCFSMAALRSADDAFLLGEMAPHTLNAGKVYFPAGTPDLNDVFDGRVDLDASAKRELWEETGLSAEDAAIERGWTVVLAGPRVACMKEMALPLMAEDAKARIDAFLALDPHAELSRIHVVRGPDDLDRLRTPEFVADYVRASFVDNRSR